MALKTTPKTDLAVLRAFVANSGFGLGRVRIGKMAYADH
jgi:hypothetical protein